MNRQEFIAQLQTQPLLLDGAMGTLLHHQGVPLGDCFDTLNLTAPARVATVHRAFIEAGADIIETNSFGANSFKLANFGLANQVTEINQAAVNVAQRVVAGSFKPVYVAGAIGPLGVRLAPLGRVSKEQAQAAYQEQIAALVAGGVDLLILETMSDVREAKLAVRVARQLAPDLPLVVQMTFTRDDRTVLGDTPAGITQQLSQLDLDILGINCSSGPQQVARILATLHQAAPHLPLSAVPNAGWPEQTSGGRVIYPASPAYFGRYAQDFIAHGAVIVGGCCGTHTDHIRAMRHALDETPPHTPHPAPHTPQSAPNLPSPISNLQPPSTSRLAHALKQGHFITTVEMRPPKGIATHRLLAGAQMLKEAGADFLNIADSPLARMRMSAWAVAHLVQQELGIEAVLHFPTRGRNLLRIQGDLLAAHTLGIHNLFVVMGDPTHIGDYPEAMNAYDIVPTGLVQLITQRLNKGVEQSGQAIDQPTQFTVGCALSLTPANPGRERRLLHKKIKNGADFALTQPVFDVPTAQAFLASCHAEFGEAMIPIIAGIQPLYNARNTAFLHNEVPGIVIPAGYRQRMQTTPTPQNEGLTIAQDILRQLKPNVQGAYLIPQFGRYDLIANLLDTLKTV